jgi:hypothetical protein
VDEIRPIELACCTIESLPHIANYQRRRMTAHVSKHMAKVS